MKPPKILIVDDHPEVVEGLAAAIKAHARGGGRAHCIARHPQDISSKELTEANLVLVDFKIEDWPGRDGLPVALQPANGVALVGVLRSHTDDGCPTAFAIHTGHPNDLSGDLPAFQREHSLARAFGLEWFFQKQAKTETRVLRMIELAVASAQLPAFSREDSILQTQTKLTKLLGLQRPKPKWFDRAWREIEHCRPPVREFSKWSHSLSILNWLLQRVLPYPCFLWSDEYLAARCGVTLASLQSALSRSSALRSFLGPCLYRGICSTFLGRRWWRAGIENLLWEVGEGRSLTRDELFQYLSRLTRRRVSKLAIVNPVVTVNEDFVPNGVAEVSDAVRLGPDDWPPYASEAWASVESVGASAILSAVVFDNDRNLLPPETT